MAAAIHLEIVTPSGVELRADVSEFTAPSVDGEFGVLPGHRPLLAALRTGIVSYTVQGVETRVAVGPGFAEIADDHANLLTDRYVTKDAIDPVRTRLDLKEADEALDHYVGDPDSPEYNELVLSELWAAVRLELFGDPPPPTVRSTTHDFQRIGSELYREPHDDEE
jgi:F-type H+-transporting ATPase subunit epsilon